MGVYTEYLDKALSFPDLQGERHKWLGEISKIRKRAVLVYAADLNKGSAPISIAYNDLTPLYDQVSNLQGEDLDFIIETPGGSAEVAEDMVCRLRERFRHIAVIVPGWAKSAGTIMAMAADEILMSPTSALGPIDAQIGWQGKSFSAGELLDGMEKIKEEVTSTGTLNKSYIPILQGISPGELQRAENAQKFSVTLVTQWLARFKFKDWTKHSSTGAAVTEDEKTKRAEEVAAQLQNHRKWLTHGRSIRIPDLEAMRLKVTDYSKDPTLHAAIQRYHTLLQMTFDTNIYKVFETPASQIYRFMAQEIGGLGGEGPKGGMMRPAAPDAAVIEARCGKCGHVAKVQANIGAPLPLAAGFLPFPADNKFKCPTCGTVNDLSGARRQIEMQTKKPIVI